MRRTIALALTLAAAACVPSAPPLPQPTPVPVPTPVVQPTPAPAPRPTGDWRDWPLTPGDWVYRQDARGSIALFGVRNQDALFTIRCDRQRGKIYLSRKGAAPDNVPMTIRTTSLLRQLRAAPTGGTPPYMAVELDPHDPLLDAMGYSRGRFVVEETPQPILVIPAYAEVERVTEDCR